ncbi:MAG: hypothetical protein IJD04_05595 [Desulfovibrionaceae bacterium]|nr:hypothetical protein [Desulfovibrionaceae bacterium]
MPGISPLFFRCLLLALAFILLPACVNDTKIQRYKVGFRLLMAASEGSRDGVEFILWYPGKKNESEVNLGEWSLKGGRNASPEDGKFPLIIISHDAGANKFSYHDTARQLASAGFVVAAPTHRGDNSRDMSNIYTAEQIFGRIREIHLLAGFLSRGEYQNFVDISRIGILSVGSGAAAALILGGGKIDISAYSQYCADAGKADNLCSDWVRQRLTTLSFYLPESPDAVLDGVKAIALAAPDNTALFSAASLSELKSRVHVFDTALDATSQIERLDRIMPPDFGYLRLPDMDRRDLTAPCGEGVLPETVWMCDPDPNDSMETRQKFFNSQLLKFFAQQIQ